ncbi:MAG: polyribonucleotide nucleotidyltransferase, partial [Planctomycetales bacterium]|nr:polyribonucleotide nucleotidyltransferase [Planctomycetales bacterium]
MPKVQVTREIGGRTLTIETGRLARQADGASLVRYADTVVLAAVATDKPRDVDFFPLQVDYRERASAAGKFPGGFFKREGRPTLKETLTSRLIDRPIRPLFPDGYRREIQLQSFVLSADQENDPDVVAMNAASAALAVSPLPWLGPLGAVRVGLIEGKFVVNPTLEQLGESDLEMVVAATKKSIVMVEAGAREVPEAKILEALEFAQGQCRQIAEAIEELAAKAGAKHQTFEPPAHDEALEKAVRKATYTDLLKKIQTHDKRERREALRAWKSALVEKFTDGLEGEKLEARQKELGGTVERLVEEGFRELIVKGVRADGRTLDGIRPITCEVGVLPRTHGSSLFTRGETQALVTATLGAIDDEQRVEGLHDEYRMKFLLHYNFPSFSVGEVKPIRGPGRREIGHGALAERAVEAVLPPYDTFPYTIRIVSDILESNGSSSMATVCGGTLALLDAGVPLRSPVAGIAMGLVIEKGETRILSDILGDEDHFGEMDFKVAGTTTGITALQMDIKNTGVSSDLMSKALDQARAGRLFILEQMKAVMPGPRAQMSPHAPRHVLLRVDPEKIGAIIGPGGRVINKIQEDTGSEIEVDDDGRVLISSATQSGIDRARAIIEGLTTVPEVGQVYKGRVVSMKDFGAFVEFLPGQEGLVHISELGEGYVERVEDVVKLGDEIEVRVISIDDQGRVKLSCKPPGSGGRDGGGGGGGGRGGRGGPPRGRGGPPRGDRGERPRWRDERREPYP